MIFNLLAIDRVSSEIVVVDCRHNISNLLKTVFRDIVESADERTDVASAGTSSQKCLWDAEAKRHVDGNALGRKGVGCSKTLNHSGNLHDDVRRDCGKLTTISDDLVAIHGNRFSRDRAIRANNVADALDVVVEVVKLPTDACIKRRVRRDAGKGAPACSLLDFRKVCGVKKELHGSSSNRVTRYENVLSAQ